MADPTLSLLDGFDVLHAGGFADLRRLGAPAGEPLVLSEARRQRGSA